MLVAQHAQRQGPRSATREQNAAGVYHGGYIFVEKCENGSACVLAVVKQHKQQMRTLKNNETLDSRCMMEKNGDGGSERRKSHFIALSISAVLF